MRNNNIVVLIISLLITSGCSSKNINNKTKQLIELPNNNLIKNTKLIKCDNSYLTSSEVSNNYIINNNKVIELNISKKGPTRVSIDKEVINDIFIYPEDSAEVKLHSSGCVIILPQKEANKVYMTIFSDQNTVQDLILNFQDNIFPKPIKLMSLQ